VWRVGCGISLVRMSASPDQTCSAVQKLSPNAQCHSAPGAARNDLVSGAEIYENGVALQPMPSPMNASLIPRRPLRERFFFGVGMAILPPFWAWWTLGRRFTARQQSLAFLWANVYLLLILLDWRFTGDRILAMTMSYEHILFTEATVLGLWLLARIMGWGQLVVALVVSTDIIAMLPSVLEQGYAVIVKHHPSAAFWIPLQFFLGVVSLHLMLGPWNRSHTRCTHKPTS
jgi:hypothetical protein